MSTQLTELYFNTLTDDNPYGLGEAPDFLNGYSIPTGSVLGRITLGSFARSTTGNSGVWLYDTPFATNEVEVALRFPATFVSMASRGGVCLADSAGNGYALLFTAANPNYTITVATMTGCTVSASPLATYTATGSTNADKWLKLQRNQITGGMSVLIDDTVVGTLTDTTYTPPRGGVIAIGGQVRAIRLTDLSSYLVDSFNGANDIERGQQNVAYSTSGFSSITDITTNTAGVTVSGISDTSGDGNCDISDYVEAGLYPALPATVIYTFGDGTNTAQITKTLTIKSTESAVTTSGMISINDSYLGYHFQAAGRSIADGGQIVWPTTTDLTINADGSYSYSPGGTLEITLWYRDPSNGRVYEFNATFGGSSGGGGNGITMAGITAAGITMTGIAMVGL